MGYLIGQISNLTLEPLDLPPQVFFFLVHSFPVAPLFSEIFFKDLHLLRKNQIRAGKKMQAASRPNTVDVRLPCVWPAPLRQRFAWGAPASSGYWRRRRSWPGQVVVARTKANASLRLPLEPAQEQRQSGETIVTRVGDLPSVVRPSLTLLRRWISFSWYSLCLLRGSSWSCR